MPREDRLAIPNVTRKIDRLFLIARAKPEPSPAIRTRAKFAEAMHALLKGRDSESIGTAGRFSQIFGGPNPSAGKGVARITVEALVQVFNDAEIPLTLDLLTGPMPAFDLRFPQPAASLLPPAAPTVEQEPVPPSTDFEPPVSAFFTGTDADPPDPVASLVVHTPTLDNLYGAIGGYRLPASVGFAAAERVPEGSNQPLRVGLHAARLSVTLEGYQLAPDTLFGAAANPFEPAPGDATMVRTNGTNLVDFRAGPEGALLEGNPLDGRMLGIITPAGAVNAAKQPAVRLNLTAAPRDFEVAPIGDKGEPLPSTPTKDALIALVYAKSLGAQRNPVTGRLLLATATLRRKPATRET